jgi:hypothetical protein
MLEQGLLLFNVARHGLLRLFVPRQVKGTHTFAMKKLKFAVGQMVMDPIRQGAPISSTWVAVCEPWNRDTRGRAAQAFFVAPVLYVSSKVTFRLCTVVPADAKIIDGDRSIG